MLRSVPSISLSLLLYCLVGTTAFSQVQFSCSHLPIISIDTQGQQIDAEERIIAEMTVYDSPVGGNCLTDTPTDQGRISIGWRGQTSLDYEKKQYKLETQTSDGENRNVSLLGLPEENDWILYGPYNDKSLIRNALAFSISRDLGHYAARSRPCELLLNGEYRGLYWFTEKIKRDDERLDVATLKPTDISGDELTGGYLLKIDAADDEPCGWQVSGMGPYVQPHDPDCEAIVSEQQNYIIEQSTLLHEAITDSSISPWWMLDLESAVDYFLVNELAKNIDAYRKSTFFYKQKDSNGGMFKFGPVWDFNIAFGNADYLEGFTTEDFIAERNIWWEHIVSDSVFLHHAGDRWADLRCADGLFHSEAIMARMDSLTDLLGAATQRNFDRWDIQGHYVWPNYFFGDTHDEDLDYLRSWVVDRTLWMDSALDLDCPTVEDEPSSDFQLFPNPFRNTLNLVVELEYSSRVEIELFDTKGLRVYHKDFGRLEAGGRLLFIRVDDTDTQSQGLYLARILVEGDTVYRQSVLKGY